MNPFLNLGDQGSSQLQISELIKALEATGVSGGSTVNSLTASGAPLKRESLEGMLKILTYENKHFTFWNAIPKMPATNTVEEYVRLISRGNNNAAFVSETALPEEADSIFERKSVIIKYLAAVKSVSMALEMTNNIVPAKQQAIIDGTLDILRNADWGLSWGNSSTNTYQFDGMYKSHQQHFASLDAWQNSSNVIDRRGKILTEAAIKNGAVGIYESGFGSPNFMISTPKVLEAFSNDFLGKKLVTPNTVAVTAGVMGQAVESVQTQFGLIKIENNIFMAKDLPRRTSSSATNVKAPTAPVSVSVTATTDTATRFTDGDGDYFYAVAAKNQFGISALTALNSGSAVSVATTEAVDLRFTDGGGVYPATGYVIYRSKVDPAGLIAATDLYPIMEVSVAELSAGYDGGAAGRIRDRNRFLPGTEIAIIAENSSNVWAFKQLSVLSKIELAQVSQVLRMMIFLYGAPVLYAPQKMTIVLNIGDQPEA